MIVVFTFDDGWEEDIAFTYPLFKKYGFRATSYLCLENTLKTKGKMSWNDIRLLAKDNWDFQCHGYSHVNFTKLSENNIYSQMERVNSIFTKEGLCLPKHHCYPYGSTDNKVVQAISKYRITGRQTKNGTPIKSSLFDDFYRIKGIKIKKLSTVKKSLSENFISVFYTHKVTPTPNAYSIHVREMEKILRYVKEIEARVLTMREMYEEFFSADSA